LIDVVRVVGVGLFLAIVALVIVIFHKHHAHAAVKESRWAATLRHVIEGLHVMGNARTLSQAAGVSGIYLLVQAFSVWFLMKAYDLDLSFWAAFAVLTILRFGTVIPSAPGNLGLFQASCVLALTLFGVERDAAKTFSFIMFFAITLPLLVGGAIAVALTGLKLHEIRHRARRGFEAHHAEPLIEN
jgi:glycosyltransferase 2 family protein